MRISILVLLMAASAATVRAQGREAAIFTEGAFLGDYASRFTARSAAAGGSGAMGFRISEHFSVRFEAEVPVMHIHTFIQNYGGLKSVDTEEFRITTYAGLFAGHYQAHKRVNLAFLAGLSAAIPETRASGYYEELRAGVIVRRDINSGGSYRTGALTAGVDVALGLTPHLAVVPELRFHGLNDESATRAKVAVRWTF